MLTVEEVLATPGLGLALSAGAGGARRPIRWVASSELADPTPWLRGGEFLLTTGLGLGETPAEQRAYVERLDAAGLSGLAFGVGLGRDAIPPAVCAAADELSFPLVVVPYATPFVAVTEAVMTRLVNEQYLQLERSVAVHDALLRLVLEERGIEEIVAAVAEMTQVTALLVDREWRPLARRCAGPELDEAAEAALIEAARACADELDAAPAAQTLALAISVESRRDATLIVVGDAAFREGDRIPFQHARTVLALELMKRRAVRETERRLAGDLIEELLAERATERELERRLRAFGLEPADGLAFIVARPLESPDTAALAALHRRAAPLLEGAPVALRDGVLCALVRAADDADAEAVAISLAERLDAAARPVLAGVSSARTRALELRQAYDEALYALEARAAQVEPGSVGPQVGAPRDLGSLQLLLALQDDRGVELFCRAALGPLDDSGTRNGSELLRSLEAFIEANGRWADASAALDVHRHTLRYRIRRIEELTGRDLSDARSRLELWLAIRARRIRARRSGDSGDRRTSAAGGSELG